jgi:dihydroorotase
MKFARQRLLGLSVRPMLRIQVCSHVHLGVKSYPRGVTTNSDGGIESYEAYYPVFEAMQDVDMVLNLHGEVPSDASAVGLESFLVPPTLICV